MEGTTPLELVGELPHSVKAKLCRLLDEDDEWERLVRRFIEVKVNLFSIKELKQQKHPSSPSLKLLQVLIKHNFKTLDLYKVLATLNLLKEMDCLKEYAESPQSSNTISYIYQLPEDVRKELCYTLDHGGDWKHLLARFEDAGFDFLSIDQCKMESPSTPSSELIKQLGDRNFKISLLYTALATLKLFKAMSFLECHVSENLRSSLHKAIEADGSPLIEKPQNTENVTSKADTNITRGPVQVSSYMQLQRATEGWSEDRYLDSKQKGNFFRGRWNDRDVAIKRLRLKDRAKCSKVLEELRLFQTVKLNSVLEMMFIEGDGDPCLIYPFIKNGSLYDAIKNGIILSWKERHSIAINVAEAMSHLNKCFKSPVVFKSSDILLNDKMEPLVADICLPCLLDENSSGDLSQYIPLQEKHKNLDTFCLGTILLELALGKPAETFTKHPEEVLLSLMSSKKGCVNPFPLDDRAGEIRMEMKNNWIGTVNCCITDDYEISCLIRALKTYKYYN